MIKRFFIYRLSICCSVLLLALIVNAQSNFLYIQSENNQPYYIQFKGNTYGSNGKGYLFIPQLPNGNHNITISFPGDQYGEYTFSFTVADKPKGYALRITQDGEWMLMDMVTTELLKGIVSGLPVNANAPKQIQKLSERSNDAGFDQRYTVKNGTKIDTVAVFIPAIMSSSSTRVAQKAGSKTQVQQSPAKIKVPLVPGAYGEVAPKKSGKQ